MDTKQIVDLLYKSNGNMPEPIAPTEDEISAIETEAEEIARQERELSEKRQAMEEKRKQAELRIKAQQEEIENIERKKEEVGEMLWQIFQSIQDLYVFSRDNGVLSNKDDANGKEFATNISFAIRKRFVDGIFSDMPDGDGSGETQLKDEPKEEVKFVEEVDKNGIVLQPEQEIDKPQEEAVLSFWHPVSHEDKIETDVKVDSGNTKVDDEVLDEPATDAEKANHPLSQFQFKKKSEPMVIGSGNIEDTIHHTQSASAPSTFNRTPIIPDKLAVESDKHIQEAYGAGDDTEKMPWQERKVRTGMAPKFEELKSITNAGDDMGDMGDDVNDDEDKDWLQMGGAQKAALGVIGIAAGWVLASGTGTQIVEEGLKRAFG